jgi:triosephosphate isomerase (TIM)
MNKQFKSAFGGKKIIIANWKMNLTQRKALQFIKLIKKSKNQVIIAAPLTFVNSLYKYALAHSIKLAAQNVSQFVEGAFTGEISARMLKEAGCTYSLVGHSERRIYFQETDSAINQKIKNLLNAGIIPVICLGENFNQRKQGRTKEIIENQLKSALQGIKNPEGILIAYEPVWAISTFQKGKTKHSAGILDIIEAQLYIKKILLKLYKNKANTIRIIYGGTVNPVNCREILSLKEVDGALVGGASLKVSSINAIIRAI